MKKTWHWVVLILALIGGVYVFHNFQSHGGFSGVRQSLGMNTYA
jgi:hypothetical protein